MSGSKPQTIPVTPKGNFSGPVIVDPVTRIEGHLRIETVVENGKVVDVRSSSQLFRGLEIILKGRDPRDAQHFTQRSCGVCTYTHALASTRAVDNAVKVKIPKNAILMRNLVMASQYLHDHLVHFYHLHALDWVNVANALKADPAKTAALSNSLSAGRKETAAQFKAVQDKVGALVASGKLGIFTNAYFLGEKKNEAYYLPAEADLMATKHYLDALHMQVKAARAMAIFGAKNPHTQFTVVGGVTNYDALKPERMAEYKALTDEVTAFIRDFYIPDVIAIGTFYKDWGSIGGTTNFLTFGEFPTDEYDLNARFFAPGLIMKRDLKNPTSFDPNQILEHVKHSWYVGDKALHPYQGVTEPKYTSLEDKDRYSWMKAPRYNGESCEVGPLAAMLVAYAKGHKPTVDAVNMVLAKVGVGPAALFSTLGRTAARAIECLVTANQIPVWLEALSSNVKSGDTELYTPWKMPDEAEGVGYATAPRGALSHWIKIKKGKIENFQLVVPSTWNLGPRCAAGKLGPVEEALMGTPIFDPARPVEILRTVHSFDPCIACGVHVLDAKTGKTASFKVL
ncbi:[NiFe] hydrogenase large subunit [Humidesulfovibrio mexicanus]|uniref:Periplasmic [NiFe] hydrogenase large subunit n=1 Tax=Humidesulfovibrio mexicanus TaxID=147047 RepID=A0A238YV81_9BACT|nr:nickel-dependent hydrogenase large subunit [Humidesulfovibrio mexicanus]SNR74544.1 [NiFe] hydrogenase large subunit [Humidesulfovibrio mexicanus]